MHRHRGHVGIAQQIFRLPLAGEAERDADARSDRNLDVIENQRVGKSFQHALGDAHCVFRAAYLFEQDCKFVAAQPRYGVFFPGAFDEPLRHPGVVAPGALLEPVPFLAELAARGVRAAAFEGVPIA